MNFNTRKSDAASRSFPASCNLAFSLIEMLLYITVLAIILGAGYAAVIHSIDNSTLLRNGTGDVANALHAGENWRADVRTAHGKMLITTNGEEQILLLPGRRMVSYRFATNTVSRRLGNNEWSVVLGNVEASTFIRDPRTNIVAWRWELELKPRARKPGRIRPLFTFYAVPGSSNIK